MASPLLSRSAVSRDYRKLRTFSESDALVVELYELTRTFAADARWGMLQQLRRAAISVPANIAEGSTRASTADYCRFLEIATGSARECAYLLDLSRRLAFGPEERLAALASRYDVLCRSLTAMTNALRERG
jgi:four helix bundle protein